MQKKRSIIMVGAFPPPVHGMAAVNAAVRELLIQEGKKPHVIDLAAKNLDRSVFHRIERGKRVLCALASFAVLPGLSGSTLYINVSGGFGQVYELLFMLVARLRSMRLFLHHHTYSYLDSKSKLFALIANVAGKQAVHITLSPGMSGALKATYGVKTVRVVSNAIFVDRLQAPWSVRARGLRTIGFLSNISAEKGVFEFLDVMTVLQENRSPILGKLAGPFQDSGIEHEVRARLAALQNVEYVGPVYGANKTSFISTVDALVFPTKYKNEAEPLTLHEVMSQGIPVIAYGRGAIPEIIGPECGTVVDPRSTFVPAAIAQLFIWQRNPRSFFDASVAAQRRYEHTRSQSERRWGALFHHLKGDIRQEELAA